VFRNSAHIYDLVQDISGKDYAAEAATVDEVVRRRNPAASSLLDVACGTGRHLGHFSSRYKVVGVDLDPGMLAQARQRLPDVTLVEGDMRTFNLGRRFDVVVCLFSSIGYMGSVDDLAAAVARMAAHVEVGGVVVVDGWIRPEAWIEPGTVHALAGMHDGTAVARVARSRRDGDHTHLDFEYLVATLDGIEHLVDRHVLTLFTDDAYQRAFRGAGLGVERVVDCPPGRDRYIGVRSG